MQKHYYAIVGDIPKVSKVTRDIWELEPEKEDASNVDI